MDPEAELRRLQKEFDNLRRILRSLTPEAGPVWTHYVAKLEELRRKYVPPKPPKPIPNLVEKPYPPPDWPSRRGRVRKPRENSRAKAQIAQVERPVDFNLSWK